MYSRYLIEKNDITGECRCVESIEGDNLTDVEDEAEFMLAHFERTPNFEGAVYYVSSNEDC
jgi:hypothetical protein